MHRKDAGSALRDGPMPKAEAARSVLIVTKMMPELRRSRASAAMTLYKALKKRNVGPCGPTCPRILPAFLRNIYAGEDASWRTKPRLLARRRRFARTRALYLSS